MATAKEDSYSGDSSYRYVDELIKNGDDELLIVSPYISNYYIRMLVKKSGNKLIRIVTSKSSLGYKGTSIRNYLTNSVRGYMKAIAFMALLEAISIYLKFNYTTAILAVILLIMVLLAYRKYKKTDSNIKVKVAKDKFVHEKLYIGSDMAIVGSANLTFNGMHRNVEHIDIIRSKDQIDRLKTHFESLWRSN